jgi:hypothetical protein
MHRLARRTAAVFLMLSLTTVIAWPAQAARTDTERAERAIGFIARSQQRNGSVPAFSPIGSTADAVLAIVAAGTGRPTMRRALDYLERQATAGNVNSAGLQAKVVLAWSATGRPARTIGGQPFVRELRQALAADSVPAVFDVALAVLAVHAAGAVVPPTAIQRLRDDQCADGGWAYDGVNPGEDEHCAGGAGDFFLSDTNTTAVAIQALAAAGGEAPTNPFPFLREIRDTDRGGWGYSWGFETTDANSTALVLQAYAARGRALPGSAVRALRSLQYARCGAFGFTFASGARTDPDVGATVGAVPGLLGRGLPFTGSVVGPAPATPACPS